MRQSSHGMASVVTRLGVGSLGLLCAFSLLPTHNVGALPIDPLLNTIISLTKPSQADDADVKPSQGKGSASNGNSAAQPASSKAQAPPSTSAPALVDPVVVAEPLPELPTIEAPELQQPVRTMSHSNVSAVATSAVLGVKVNDTTKTPLRVSSQGWMIFGIIWYWWVIILVATYYLGRRAIDIRNRRRLSDNAVVS
jgi:hypothetical protein